MSKLDTALRLNQYSSTLVRPSLAADPTPYDFLLYSSCRSVPNRKLARMALRDVVVVGETACDTQIEFQDVGET